MAKLTVTVTLTVILTTLFVFSHARIPLSQPSNLVAEYKPSSESVNTLRLPSEKSSESEPEPKSESDTDVIKIDELLPSSNDNNNNNNDDAIRAIGISRPLTITFDVSFRPINRHFHHMHMMDKQQQQQQLPHPFWGRFPHRCRHHGGKQQMMGPREVSYGNDMIMSDKIGSGTNDREVFMKTVPVRPFRVYGKPLSEVEGHKEIVVPEAELLTRDKVNWVEKEREQRGGFLDKIRKFLHHF